MNAATKDDALGFTVQDRGVLSLRLPAGWPENAQPVSWWWCGAQKDMRHGVVMQLGELPMALRGGRVWVWTPAADTMLAQVTLPTSSRARIAQALPYALEDQLLGEPESLHFAYRAQGGGNLAVGVTERSRLRSWIDALRSAGIEPAVLSPAILALPWDGRDWSMTPEDGELIVRTGPWSGFSCDLAGTSEVPEVLAIALREARAGASPPDALVFCNPPAGTDPDLWSAALQLPVRTEKRECWAQTLGASGFSLLQEEFSPTEPVRELFGALRPAGILLLLWIIAGFGVDLGTLWHLKRVEAVQRHEMFELFRRSFPDAHNIVDPPLQMARELASLQSGSGRPVPGDFLPLLAQAAPAIQAESATHLRGLNYSDSILTLDLRVADYQAIETLRGALAARGLRAKVMDAASHHGAVEGRIRIKPELSP